LCFNGWYDPRGALDGRAEIPLLLGLAPRLARRPRAGLGCLVFGARRAAPLGPDPAARLDNRLGPGEEDPPGREQRPAARRRRGVALSAGEPAADLAPYLDYLRAEMPVEARALGGGAAAAAHA